MACAGTYQKDKSFVLCQFSQYGNEGWMLLKVVSTSLVALALNFDLSSNNFLHAGGFLFSSSRKSIVSF